MVTIMNLILSLQLVKLFGAPMVILGYKPSIIIFPEKVKERNLAFLFFLLFQT
jgi:hypothetical protein